MPSVTPHLVVSTAERAIAFYRDAFGAVEEYRLTEPGGRIGHAELRIGDGRIYLSDEYPEYGILGPSAPGRAGVSIALVVDDVDAVVQKALDLGAQLERPVRDEFYGERTGTIHDPFGHRWQVASMIEAVSAEEMQRRYDAVVAAQEC